MVEIRTFDPERFESQVNLEDRQKQIVRSKNSIKFGAFIELGLDWGQNDWTSYTMQEEVLEVVRPRINELVEDTYYNREIGVTPFGYWKRMIKVALQNEANRLGPLYNQIAAGVVLDVTNSTTKKSKDVASDFPQAPLTNNEEYATSQLLHEELQKDTIGTLDIIERYANFTAPDAEMAAAVKHCFSNFVGRLA